MFAGFPEEAIQFFLGLRFHNNASYFNAHKGEYEAHVKKPFFAFIDAMAPTLEMIADDFELRPEKCLARIRRDTRFTKDKTPYRDHLWLLFRRSGESRDGTVMYWFELSPDTVNWGLGFWGENRPAMNALRDRMITRPSNVIDAFFQAQIPDESLIVEGDVYRRFNIPAEIPDALRAYYPRKSLYISKKGVPLSDAYSAGIVKQCANDLLRLKPLYTLFRELADIGIAAIDA